mgnify:FL=1
MARSDTLTLGTLAHFKLLTSRYFLDTPEPEPMRAVDRIFWRPTAGGPDKAGRSQKTSPPHGQVIFDPSALTHLPDVTAHVLTAERAHPLVE